MVGFGHLYIRRNGTAYHTQCDPDKPPPECWCGGEIGPTETEHQGCFDRRVAMSRFCGVMAGMFSAPFVNWPKLKRFK